MSIALVDCNSFFCSCERLFRPDLKNKPVVVLSNNDGCAIARTKEAKLAGVEMAAPYFKFKDLCRLHDIAVFSSNFSIYTNISKRVMKVLSQYSPQMEAYSIDEAFMDLRGIKNPFAYASEIKREVEQRVGIPVSVGVGPTKTLAKLANYLAKALEIGVVELTADQSLAKIPIEKVWGIGRRGALKMRALGIKSAQALRDYSNEELIKKMFTTRGWQTKRELAGEAFFPIESVAPAKKEIMCSRTFSKAVFDFEGVQGALASFASHAAKDLRSQNSYCGVVGIYLRSDFGSVSECTRLSCRTSDTRKIIAASFTVLEKLFRPGEGYRKAGVYLADLEEEGQKQLHLFEVGDQQSDNTLMKIMDFINEKEGVGTLRFGACDMGAWHMNRNFKSPRYLSSWRELARVR